MVNLRQQNPRMRGILKILGLTASYSVGVYQRQNTESQFFLLVSCGGFAAKRNGIN
jgi:hypothetical protein